MPGQSLFPPVAIGVAFILGAALSEAQAMTFSVTATLAQVNVIGAQDTLGDSSIANFTLADASGHPKGTLAAHCTITSVPPLNTLEQCVITAVLPDGQIVFGGIAPPAAPGTSAEFAVFGGTASFHKARGTVVGFVNPSGTIDFTFMLP